VGSGAGNRGAGAYGQAADPTHDAEEALRGSSRFEPLHLALASWHRLMKMFRAIVRPQSLLMAAGQVARGDPGGGGYTHASPAYPSRAGVPLEYRCPPNRRHDALAGSAGFCLDRCALMFSWTQAHCRRTTAKRCKQTHISSKKGCTNGFALTGDEFDHRGLSLSGSDPPPLKFSNRRRQGTFSPEA
jgi:hypothetical protein